MTGNRDAEATGGELFIVDNSISGWTGLRYLRDWTELAHSFDIATGFFEIGALLDLDGQWQKLDKIRILMGADVTLATKAAFLAATKARAEDALDRSLEDEKGPIAVSQGRCGDRRGSAIRPDRVSGLHQGQVPRQGVHHPREAGSGRPQGVGRLIELHASWLDSRTSS